MWHKIVAYLEEGLEEMGICEGEGQQGQECAEPTLQHCRTNVLNRLIRLLVPVSY
jgi:hypothetical protein